MAAASVASRPTEKALAPPRCSSLTPVPARVLRLRGEGRARSRHLGPGPCAQRRRRGHSARRWLSRGRRGDATPRRRRRSPRMQRGRCRRRRRCRHPHRGPSGPRHGPCGRAAGRRRRLVQGPVVRHGGASTLMRGAVASIDIDADLPLLAPRSTPRPW